jgi:hypothetical protein
VEAMVAVGWAVAFELRLHMSILAHAGPSWILPLTCMGGIQGVSQPHHDKSCAPITPPIFSCLQHTVSVSQQAFRRYGRCVEAKQG